VDGTDSGYFPEALFDTDVMEPSVLLLQCWADYVVLF
jgi:hypothetical protein